MALRVANDRAREYSPPVGRLRSVGGIAAVVIAGCATAQMAKSPDDLVAERQRLMKLNGASWKDVQDKLKAGTPVEAIAVNAETMAQNSMRITSLFPQGAINDKSKAKREIWLRRGEEAIGVVSTEEECRLTVAERLAW